MAQFIVAGNVPELLRDKQIIVLDLDNTTNYQLAIEVLKKIIQTSSDNEIKLKAQMELARNYFFKGDYDQATQLCNDMLNSEIDSKTALNAKMILLSIDRKRLNK